MADFIIVKRRYSPFEWLFMVVLSFLVIETVAFYAFVFIPAIDCQDPLDHVVFLTPPMTLLLVSVVALWRRNWIAMLLFLVLAIVAAGSLLFDIESLSYAEPGLYEVVPLVELLAMALCAIPITITYYRSSHIRAPANPHEVVALNAAD